MNKYPKVSVIVPLYNAETTIRNCLKSILAMDYPDFEVIVVNDKSTDGSGSIASSLPCKLLTLEKNSGQGIARNEGARIASGEIVAFSDADCEVPRDWLRKIVESFHKHDIGAVSGAYSKSTNSGLVALFQLYDFWFRHRNTPIYVNSCCGPNLACRKTVFEEIGGFPSECGSEDMEFGTTLSKKYKILWHTDNGVAHYFNNNLGCYFAKQILWARSATKQYLSNPKIIFEKNRWSNSEICVGLFFITLLYVSLIGILWNPNSIFVFVILLISYLIINIKAIKFIAEKEGYLNALKMLPLLFIKNTAWLLGVISAVFKYFKGLKI